MLHAKIVRSTVPHGLIERIDFGAALEVPGVRMVVTAAEVKTVTAVDYYGPAFHDQPVLAIDKVRYVGEPVACVLAETSTGRGIGGRAGGSRISGTSGGL